MIKFGDKASQKEIEEVFPHPNNLDKKREVKYVYVHTSIIDKFLPGFYLEWGISACGFGQLIFSTHDGRLSIDTEAMALEDLYMIIDFLQEKDLNKPEINNFLKKYSSFETTRKNQLKKILKRWFDENE